jgi:hypothetical protein
LLDVHLTIERVKRILPAVLAKPLLPEPRRERDDVERPEVPPDVRDDELARTEASFPLLNGEERHVPEAELAHGVAPGDCSDRLGLAALELGHCPVRIG